jgi:60S ribosome subunit biogenesis protein NIP7
MNVDEPVEPGVYGREDGDFVFRLHNSRVYYINTEVLKMASHIGKEELVSAGTCFGKFTKT